MSSERTFNVTRIDWSADEHYSGEACIEYEINEHTYEIDDDENLDLNALISVAGHNAARDAERIVEALSRPPVQEATVLADKICEAVALLDDIDRERIIDVLRNHLTPKQGEE